MLNIGSYFVAEPAWEFMKKLEDVEGQERQRATFECDVSDPEAEVTWFRDEKVRSRSLKVIARVVCACKF